MYYVLHKMCKKCIKKWPVDEYVHVYVHISLVHPNPLHARMYYNPCMASLSKMYYTITHITIACTGAVIYGSKLTGVRGCIPRIKVVYVAINPSMVTMLYRRLGFNYEYLLNANCKCFYVSQLLDSQT